MDDKDLLILEKLSNDSRTTLAEIAEILEMSVSSVHKRLRKLERNGVIEKYTVIINPEKFDSVTAFILLSTNDVEGLTSRLKSNKDVLEIYQTLGNFNVVLKVRSKTLEGIGNLTANLSALEDVMMLECIIATKRIKEDVWNPG
jgi:DNA-binding Lrp family transcriptional regulator